MNEVLTAAVSAHKEGRLPEAEEKYAEAIEADPQNAHARYLLGALWFEVGNLTSASKMFEQAIEIDGTQNAYRCSLGQATLAMHLYRTAVGLFEQVLRSNPSSIEAYYGAAIASAKIGSFDLSFELLDKAYDINPSSSAVHMGYALCYREKREWNWMESACKQVLVYSPGNLRAELALVESLLGQFEYKKAEAKFAEIDVSNGVLPEYYFVLGRLNEESRNYEEARDAYNRCCSGNPYHYESYFKLGRTLEEMGLYYPAYAAFSRAYYILPDKRDTMISLAGAAFLTDNEHFGYGLIRQLMTTDPNCLKTRKLLHSVLPDVDDIPQPQKAAETSPALPVVPVAASPVGGGEGFIDDPQEFARHLEMAHGTFKGPDYRHYLQRLHLFLKPAAYLEIGVITGETLSYARPPAIAVGVGMNYHIGYHFRANTKLFNLPSKRFFAEEKVGSLLNKQALELLFLDGQEGVGNVIDNLIGLQGVISPHSVIVLQDSYPICAKTAESRRQSRYWTGDVWKIIPLIKKYDREADIITIKTFPSGLTVIKGLSTACAVFASDSDAIKSEAESMKLPEDETEKEKLLYAASGDWDLLIDVIS